MQWTGEVPVVSELLSGLGDRELLDAISFADKVGIDAPFGWPDQFVDAVSAHRNRAGWPGSGEDQDIYRFHLSFRATDRRLIEGGARGPLGDRLQEPRRRGAAPGVALAARGGPRRDRDELAATRPGRLGPQLLRRP